MTWKLYLIYGFVYLVVLPVDLSLRLTTRISLLGALRISRVRPLRALVFQMGTITSALLFLYPLLMSLAPKLSSSPAVFQPIHFELAGLIFSLLGILMVSTAIVQLITSFLIWREQGAELITTGTYGIVRNPVYTGMTLVFLGVFFLRPNLPYLLCLGLYLRINHIRIRREEKFLQLVFGDQFRSYVQAVGRYCPRFWKRRDVALS